MVNSYIRTEWGYAFESSTLVYPTSALLAREFVDEWNQGPLGNIDPARVVQRSISDWSTED